MTNGATSWRGLTSGWSGPVGCTSTTARRTATKNDTARTSGAKGAWLRFVWQRIGFTSPELLYEAASVIAGMDRLLGRTWDPRRLARWEALLDESLLRSSGRARAIRRWRRSI